MRDRVNINEAYSILGLPPGASPTQVKQAYRKLVLMWHPDRFSHPQQKQEAEEKIKLINVAYSQLKFYQPSSSNQVKKTKPTTVYTNRSNAETFYNWGAENAKLGRYESALADFTHAIRINPNYIEAYKYRGLICSQLGYEYRATSDLNKATQLERNRRNKQASKSSSSWYSTPKTRKSSQKSIWKKFLQWIKRLLNFNWRLG
ncbi:J domain-containing protein [Iningainema tapete]|uniref:DnaJ domain-containing protein n=1 Tax=Iningainema tapete BLCC-T55 TaxID=2748662 RepID=A0A8J6XKZ7_9CYAN|nr:DnaJ domain-containing protein [Iningainema tapete]MBD2776663.1 DnaJ domain-containing protein [Iningainema tapete BLCC-T55]